MRNVARGPQPIPLPQGIASLIGPESLGALSGLLGTDPGAIAGLLGGIGTEIEGIEQVLPVLPRLIAAFQRPAHSKDGTRAMLDELLGVLADLGVSRADIMTRAREYGIPGEWLSTYWSE